MKQKYRSELEIIIDVLKAITEHQGNPRISIIGRFSNLSQDATTQRIEMLVSRGFVIKQEKTRKRFIADKPPLIDRFYCLTNKGIEFLQGYERFKSEIQSVT